jgi:hypothetical protein
LGLLLPLTSDGRRRGGGGRVSDAIVCDIFSAIKMNVYTIEDLEFMGIGRMIMIVTVRREGRGDRTPLYSLFYP